MPSSRPVSKPTPQRQRAKAEYARVPRKTKADDPGRYTKTPHEYGDILISGGKLGGPLMRDLLYWVERHTWGDPKRPEFAKLSLTQLARLCQSWDGKRLRPVERKSVAVALAYMEKWGIIASRERKGCSANTAKMYKLTPENWKAAPPYVPPSAAEIAEAEAEADEQPEDVPADADAQQGPEVTVTSGKVSRPQPVSVRPSRNAPPVTIRLVYSIKGFEYPVTIRPTPAANGRIVLNFSPHRSEDKANDCSRAQPQFVKSTVENKDFSEIDTVLNNIALDVWKFALDDDLVKRIAKTLGDTPVQVLSFIARKKLSHPEAHNEHSPGLLVKLAEQAKRSWAKEQALRRPQRTGAAGTSEYSRLTDEELEALVTQEFGIKGKSR